MLYPNSSSVAPTVPLAIVGLALALLSISGCSDESGDCSVIQSGEGRVVVGFWNTVDCSGDPIATNSFPIDPVAECYCWPGNSGENSADTFTCNGGDGSFTYTQYNSLTCGTDDNTPTEKTLYTTACEQDIPATIYSKILDYSACE